MGTGDFNTGGNPTMNQYPTQVGVEIPLQLLHATETGEKRRPDRPVGLYTADLT